MDLGNQDSHPKATFLPLWMCLSLHSRPSDIIPIHWEPVEDLVCIGSRLSYLLLNRGTWEKPRSCLGTHIPALRELLLLPSLESLSLQALSPLRPLKRTELHSSEAAHPPPAPHTVPKKAKNPPAWEQWGVLYLTQILLHARKQAHS